MSDDSVVSHRAPTSPSEAQTQTHVDSKLFAILINLLGVQHAAELYMMLLILAKSKPNTTVFNL